MLPAPVEKATKSIGFPAFYVITGATFTAALIMCSAISAAVGGLIVAACFEALKHTSLPVVTLLPVMFACAWLPLNYVLGRFYINKLSELAMTRRLEAARILLVVGSIMWAALFGVSTFNMLTHIHLATDFVGIFIPLGMLAPIVGQIKATRAIAKQTQELPLLGYGALPEEQAQISELENHLWELKQANKISELEQHATDCLKLLRVNTKSVEGTDNVHKLLDVLIKHNRHDDAEAVSKHYLNVVDKGDL